MLNWLKNSRIYNLNPIPSTILGLGSFLFILLISWYSVTYQGFAFKKEIDLLAISAIPLFIITIIELYRTRKIQSAALIKDHISPFITNPALYSAFHDLIYKYHDTTWETVAQSLPKPLNRDEKTKTDAMREKSWNALNTINSSRDDGCRYYDPDFFQGSLEEKRLDSVLMYFDILAYNYRNKLVSSYSISGVAGYHLAVIGSRKVITYYLKRNLDFWEKLPYHERVGSEPPYENLRRLLKSIRTYNEIKHGKALIERRNEEA